MFHDPTPTWMSIIERKWHIHKPMHCLCPSYVCWSYSGSDHSGLECWQSDWTLGVFQDLVVEDCQPCRKSLMRMSGIRSAMKIKLLAIFPKRIIDIFVSLPDVATGAHDSHCYSWQVRPERGTGAPRSRGDGVTLSGLILVGWWGDARVRLRFFSEKLAQQSNMNDGSSHAVGQAATNGGCSRQLSLDYEKWRGLEWTLINVNTQRYCLRSVMISRCVWMNTYRYRLRDDS